jgi:hypothetical protein
MTRCPSQWEVLQDGKGNEEIKPRAQAGPGAGRRRTGLRGALRGEEDEEVSERREEGCQEGRQQPQAGRASARPLGTRIKRGGLKQCRTASPQGAIPQPKKGLSPVAGALLAFKALAPIRNRPRRELACLGGDTRFAFNRTRADQPFSLFCEQPIAGCDVAVSLSQHVNGSRRGERFEIGRSL